MIHTLRCVCAALAFTAIVGCTEEQQSPPLSSLKPKPLPSVEGSAASPQATSDAGVDPSLAAAVERERLHEVEVAKVFGEEVPTKAVRVELLSGNVRLAGGAFDAEARDALAKLRAAVPEGRSVLLVPDDDTFLAQASPLLALLDDAGIKTWLLHPEGKVAFPVTLSDEDDFRGWLNEHAAGRIRVIHRADGFELQTNVGKLPGADPNGPSVPLRGGKWDIARLRTALVALEKRFDSDNESCIVPSFGMELRSVATALTGYYTGDGDPLFPALCLVYPRPRAPSQGAGRAVDAGAP